MFKAYDIRGIYPSEINGKVASNIARAFATFLTQKNEPSVVIVGRDIRLSGEEINKGVIEGLIASGFNVWDLGMVSTDTVYYASGKYDYPAIMITASHNPKEYNGMKMMLSNARSIGQDNGLMDVKEIYEREDFFRNLAPGSVDNKPEILFDYLESVRNSVDANSLKKIKIVIDAGNGMAGKIVPLLFMNMPFDIVELNFKLDGNFPGRGPNPFVEEGVKDLAKTIKDNKADFGLSFDGDADRVFFFDKQGQMISSSMIMCLIIESLLAKNPGEKILYNAVCGRMVRETISALGGKGYLSRVGHAFIKKMMRDEDIAFGGEHSGHYYYRDNYFAESAFISILLVLEILSVKDLSLEKAIEPYNKYSAIPETNFMVSDKDLILKELSAKYSDAKQLKLDGLSIEYKDWWFNVRPSNTEPLLRLNLEANTEELKEAKLLEIKKFIESFK